MINNARQINTLLMRVLFTLAVASMMTLAQAPATQAKPLESLSATEFSRLIRDFSEDGGYFRSDNFTSNETAYLYILEKLQQQGTTGGAYLGVGPEQNFTYIAKVRPRIAFIVDIRRQAVIQHLMYKAIFHLSPTRAQFLARLLSRPAPTGAKVDAALNDLLTHFSTASGDEKLYAENLAAVRKTIQEDFQFPLSEADSKSLDYVYKSFYTDGLDIAYRMDGNPSGGGYMNFPSLKEITAQTDQYGKQGNFLASVSDYEFVRGMHRKNLIIPIVGNFGGKKALISVGDYLRKNGLTVTAYYTSNVEQYLFDGTLFSDFATNISKLPLTEKSMFIRAVTGRGRTTAMLPGHRLTTFIQPMTVFVKDFKEGLYPSYRDLVTTHQIAPELPAK